MESSVTEDTSVPIEPPTQHTLAERRARIVARRTRGEPAVGLLRTAVPAIAKLFADEFREGRCVLRFGLEDIVCDEDQGRFALVADLPRYSRDDLPTGLSFLENGIYAPELTKLIQRELSPRTDVYSLGALLYFLITGLDPSPELSRLTAKLPPIRIFEPHLPLGLDPILRRALSRLPEDRFPDPEAMCDEIDAIFALDAERRREVVSPRLTTRFGSATDGGINKSTKNPRNQDQFFCALDEERELGLFLVADGVSNCEVGAGDRAAEYVVAAAESAWCVLAECATETPIHSLDLGQLLTDIAQGANEAIAVEATEIALHQWPNGDVPDEARSMSSTAVGIFRRGREVTISNLGDSRAYLIRDEWIDQITVDQDRRTQRLQRGQGLEAIANASGLGELTRAVGTSHWETDHFVASTMQPDLMTISLLPGDRILICSDGVPDCIGPRSAEQIHEIVLAADRPSRAVWNLLVAANENGGDDNITAILIDCKEEEDATCPKN